MVGRVNDGRVAVRQLLLLIALMGLAYLCIRILRFTNDVLNLVFVCVFLLIPFLGIRPARQLSHWPKLLAAILLYPSLALSLLFLGVTMSCDVPAAVKHRELTRELASVRQGSYSVNLLWRETAAGAVGPHGVALEQRLSIASGLYLVKHLEYFEGAREGSLSVVGTDKVRLRIPRTDGHQEVEKVYSLKPWLFF